MMSGQGLASYAALNPPLLAGAKAPANAAPTIVQTITVNGNSAIVGKSASLAVLGGDDGGESKLVYRWSVASAPSGATVSFSTNGTNAAKSSTATFSMAGTYSFMVTIVDAGGLSVASSKSCTVTQVWSSTKYPALTNYTVSGTTLQPTLPSFLDQFGKPMATLPALKWTTVNLPSGAPLPAVATSGNVVTITFGQAGSYMLQAVGTNSTVSFVTLATVNQTLGSIAVAPNTASVSAGSNQQFTAQAFDQFKKAFAVQPTFTWSTSAGTITSAGAFTASSSLGNCTVTAKNGTVSGTATVTVVAASGWNTPAFGNLVKSLDTDGSLSRLDVIQILTYAAKSGPVTAGELADLKSLLGQATTLNMPVYVQALAGDIINGSPANATYLGAALGNLAVGSSSTQLTNLINKWFFGTDHPVLCNTSLVYKATAGALFPQTPSHLDEVQGQMGDCYLISALGTLADSNPAAIQNAIIDNGDGTYTVRFYSGPGGVINNGSGAISAGFSTGVGTPDYITVDRMLPASSSGILQYADYGASVTNAANSLWIPLIEKAYAQWNQTGKEGRDGTNNFASIQGGWMATVDAQVLGYNAYDYIMTTTAEKIAVDALAAHKAVTIGTQNFSGTVLGLYANHAYAITGYNAATDTFTLYNPWGSNQPGQLTWSQLQATTTQLCTCDTSGTVPMGGTLKSAAAVLNANQQQGQSASRLSARLVDAVMSERRAA